MVLSLIPGSKAATEKLYTHPEDEFPFTAVSRVPTTDMKLLSCLDCLIVKQKTGILPCHIYTVMKKKNNPPATPPPHCGLWAGD